MFVTYILSDDDGVPFYVGAGNEQRPLQHMTGSGGRPLVNAIIDEHRARGSDVDVSIVKFHDTIDDAFNHEKYLIAVYGKRSEGGLLVNICDGGKGSKGYKASEESRAANSKRNIDRFSSIDERLKISLATKKAMARPDVIDKLSKAAVANWSDESFRLRQIEAHTGHKDSDLTRERKAEAQKKAWENGTKVGKYTDEQVLEVYRMKGVVNVNEVAAMYGMNPTYVHKIWRHERCVSSLKRLGIVI